MFGKLKSFGVKSANPGRDLDFENLSVSRLGDYISYEVVILFRLKHIEHYKHFFWYS
jgi:hypothetical protein